MRARAIAKLAGLRGRKGLRIRADVAWRHREGAMGPRLRLARRKRCAAVLVRLRRSWVVGPGIGRYLSQSPAGGQDHCDASEQPDCRAFTQHHSLPPWLVTHLISAASPPRK